MSTFLPRNKRRKHHDTVLYHGPIRLPHEIVTAAETATVCRTTHRHNAIRLSHEGVVYLLRTLCGRNYLGEIVRTQSGSFRVHVWSAIATDAPDLAHILARKLAAATGGHIVERDGTWLGVALCSDATTAAIEQSYCSLEIRQMISALDNSLAPKSPAAAIDAGIITR